MTQIDELQDILEQNWHNGFTTHKATLVPGNAKMDERILRDKSTEQAKAAIKELFLEIIGEDENENLFSKENPLWILREQYQFIVNDLRQQLRNTVEGKK